MSAATRRPSGTAKATASTSIASTAAPAPSATCSTWAASRIRRSSPSMPTARASIRSMAIAARSIPSPSIPRTGHLAPLNRQPTGGYNPVHLDFDATGRFLAVCNYGTDSLAVFPLADDGSLLPYRTLTTVTGTLGPHRTQQRTMCVHHIPLDAQGRFFYVPCKGSDVVIAYRLDTQAEDPGRGRARDRAAGRRAAPHRFPSDQGPGLRHQRARFDDHHLSPGPAKRRAHAAADDPGHAAGIHRLQHGRRDLGRSRRPQRLRLQSRP